MGGILCPGRGCGMGLLPEASMRSVTCGSCHVSVHGTVWVKRKNNFDSEILI